jgi:polysaccharide export outer membrane protein
MKIKHLALISLSTLLTVFFLGSCTSQKINKDFIYFQRGLDSIGKIQPRETVIKTSDVLTVKIGSRSLNQEQTRLFNMGSADSSTSTYTVNELGNIDIPIIGNIKAEGLTLVQLQAVLSEKLVTYIKNPIVSIKYAQFNVNVLGEVKSPGTKSFQTDNVTILDVISASGDLSDFAKREDILVIREENGKRKVYKVDMKSGAIFQSPVYQLRPNDFVYVPANNNKLRTINQDPSSGKALATGLTILGVAVTLLSVGINLTR